jgi:hypothetical protein
VQPEPPAGTLRPKIHFQRGGDARVLWACERAIYAARPQASKLLGTEVQILLINKILQRRAQPHDVASMNMVAGRRQTRMEGGGASLQFIHRDDMEADGYGVYLDQVEDIE